MSKPIENCPQPDEPMRDRAYTGRQLLDLAAKAVGYGTSHPMNRERLSLNPPVDALWVTDSDGLVHTAWDPLTDDGNALRLAVKLQLLVDVADHNHETVVIWADGPFDGVREPHETDPYAATRRAIVRAAAAIAEGAKS